MQSRLNFDDGPVITSIGEGACWLQGFCLPVAGALWTILQQHFKQYPPQVMMTPMGYPMSVKTSSFGEVGWVGSKNGYGYSANNLQTQKALPKMPTIFKSLAARAAKVAGYEGFSPDTCLVNLYVPNSKMGLHQDKDEQDFTQPIVSVSLGLSTTFIFGGKRRTDPKRKIPLTHGDVIVFGGESRLNYHGVTKLNAGQHPMLGAVRCNLTFRKAL